MKLLNRIALTTAFLMIISFMFFSLISEYIGDYMLIDVVKRTIFYALPLLIICVILTAVSAKKLALLHPNIPIILISLKQIKLIALNGVIFLAPLATILHYLAEKQQIDTTFYLFQSLEIICGFINIFLFIKIFNGLKSISENTN